jgi:pimeloyl-ACP methyl ester carboxylesterase
VSVEASAATGRVEHLTVDGVPLAVRHWGEPDGRPVFFWHALGAVVSGAWIAEVALALAEAGHRVVAVDGPGFGESPPLPPDGYAVPALARLLWAVIDTLGLERPVLIGHSWGGTIAVHAAADRPSAVRAVVLFDSGHLDYADVPGSNPEASLEERVEAMRGQILDVPNFDALSDEFASEIARPATPELLDALRAGIRVQPDGAVDPIVSPETRAAALQGAVDERPSQSWPVLADAAVPVLLLLATEPENTRLQNEAAAERFGAAVPLAELRWCEGWGHDLIADGGPTLAGEVLAWLDRAG